MNRNEKTLEGKFDKFFDNATQFFSKSTDRQLYTYKNILEYVDGELVITNKISDKNLLEMRENMNDEDKEEFDQFVERIWGTRTPVKTKATSIKTEKTKTEGTKKRGRKPKIQE